MDCKNCGNTVRCKYCSHCGQKAVVERITFHYLWHQLFHFFTHLEKGFLYTSLNMILRPGKTVTEYIAGKRIKYQPPVSYFLIWIAVYALLLYFVNKIFGEGTVIGYKNYFGAGVSTLFAINHLSIVLSILIPVFGCYFYLLSSRKVFNYAECLTLVIYTLGTIILMQCIFVVLSVMFFLVSERSTDLQVSDLFKIFYISWFSYSIMRQLPLKNTILRSVIFTALCFGTFSLWRLVIYPLIAHRFLESH